MKTKQKNILILVLVVVAIIGGYFYFNRKNVKAPNGNENISGEIPNDRKGDGTYGGSETIPSSDKIIVVTQSAGNWVVVDNLSLSKPGFVVIHESTADGKIGRIIGFSNWVSAGTKQDLEVKALMVAGKKYFAMLHYDDGDKKFDPAKDPMSPSEKATTGFSAQ